MTYNLPFKLQDYLSNDEEIIWEGRPKRGIIFRSSDIFLIPFSIAWCSLAFFILVKAITSSVPLISVSLLPFSAIGLILVFGRFIIDAKLRDITFYGLTTKRIFVISGKSQKIMNSINRREFTIIGYTKKSDGSGTIIIGTRNKMMIWGNLMNWWPGTQKTLCLDLINNVENVRNKIKELQKK